MSQLSDFNEQSTTISHGGIHDYNEAIKRTPKGFLLTKMHRSHDYYHWSVEYTKISEWEKKGGSYPEGQIVSNPPL